MGQEGQAWRMLLKATFGAKDLLRRICLETANISLINWKMYGYSQLYRYSYSYLDKVTVIQIYSYSYTYRNSKIMHIYIDIVKVYSFQFI